MRELERARMQRCDHSKWHLLTANITDSRQRPWTEVEKMRFHWCSFPNLPLFTSSGRRRPWRFRLNQFLKLIFCAMPEGTFVKPHRYTTAHIWCERFFYLRLRWNGRWWLFRIILAINIFPWHKHWTGCVPIQKPHFESHCLFKASMAQKWLYRVATMMIFCIVISAARFE